MNKSDHSRSSRSKAHKITVTLMVTLVASITLWAIARTLSLSGAPFTIVEESYENYCMLCEELDVKPHVAMSFRKYVRNLADVKAIHKDYLNPTKDKKGRQLQLKLIDITPEKLDLFFEERMPRSS